MFNTGILRDVRAEDYGFDTMDMTVAVLLKAYLQQMEPAIVPEVLDQIVSPGMRSIHGGTVKERTLAEDYWISIDGAKLASLIEDARAAAAISAMEWRAQEGENLLKMAIDYIRNDLIPSLSGEKYVVTMPKKMAEFITDCWLAV